MVENKKITSSTYVSSDSLLEQFFHISTSTSIGNVVLNPDEYYKNVGEEDASSPERLLFLAVIYQAILDATRDETPTESDSIKRQRKEALDWFFKEKYIDDLDTICDLAGINARWLTKIVKKIVDGDMPFDRKRINVLINSLE